MANNQAKNKNQPSVDEVQKTKLAAEQAANAANKAVKQDKIILEFVQPFHRYCKGDIAGFDKAAAKNILAYKPAVAEVYQAPVDDGEK